MLALEATPIGTWKDVIDNKYELSKDGILVHKRTRKVVKGFLTKKGYIHDTFLIDGKNITKRRHRLVFETFIGEIPKDMEVNHINEDKTDNRLCNLNLLSHRDNCNWGTHNERIGKANRLVLKNNKKKSKPIIQKSLEGEVIKVWPSIMEINRELGYEHGNISKCCKGGYYRKGKWYNLAQMYGYKWEYAEE